MSYIGDFKVAAVIDKKFTTRSFSTGAPTTLAGTPVISIYKDNDTTQTTTGITLTVDFDGVTGLHNIHIDTSNAFYTAGSNFQMVITTGTVGGVSVVGEVVGSFSIEATSALRPTVAGRTLDVSATGEAGLDFANIGAPTTVVNLSGTTIKTATDIATATTAIQADTDDIQTRLPAALTGGGNMKSDALAINGVSTGPVTTVKAVQGLAVDGVVPTVTNLTNAPTAGDLTATMKTSVTTAATAATPIAASVSGNVVGSVGSVVGLTASNLDTTVSSRASAANLVTAQADLDDIQTRLPAALIGGRMNASAEAINGVEVQGTGVLGDEWRPV